MVPSTPTDPLWGGTYAAHSFPWFDTASSLTVTATRRPLTIADVETANGMRSPAAGAGPKSYDLGIVLLVSKKDAAAKVASEEASFGPIADGFAPAFHDATKGRGTLHVVTHEAKSEGSGGGGSGGAASTSSSATGSGGQGGGADTGDTNDSSGGCGCEATGGRGSGSALLLIAVASLFRLGRDRRRSPRGTA
jgi:hypothetical protein